MRTALRPLAARRFRMLFFGRLVSFLGNAMAPVALAFAVLDLTGSAGDLGIVPAARSLPTIVLLLLGGVWADRLPRHVILAGFSLVAAGTQPAPRRSPRCYCSAVPRAFGSWRCWRR